MANHPNRNWRVRARRAARDYIAQYEPLTRMAPTPAGVQMLMREAYEAGFAAGRDDAKPKPREES